MDSCLMCDYAIGSDMCYGCPFGNPCLGCNDFDIEHNNCLSYGGCAKPYEKEEVDNEY